MASEKKRKKINIKDPSYRLRIVQEYLQLWADLFQFIDDDIRDRKLTPDDEKRFFQHVSTLAARHVPLIEIADEDLKKGEDLLKILKDCVSCSYIKTMQDVHFSKLQVDWHELFLELNKCMGRIMKDPKLIKKQQQQDQKSQQQAQA